MSKTLPSGCVFLLDPPKVIEKKIKRAVTDSQTEIRFDPEHKPGVSNLLTILATLTGRTVDQVVADLDGQQYGPLKQAAADAVVAFAEPFAKTVHALLDDPAEMDRLMAAAAQRARAAAAPVLVRAYDAMGLVAPAAP
jgi:tryptophanyl-tRNA synthetase